MTQPPGGDVVVDASAVVALLTDAPAQGAWVREYLRVHAAAAPSMMQFEAANSLRNMWLRGLLDMDALESSHEQLLGLPVEYVDYYPLLARRAWQLIANLTIYDAAYVALAEILEVPLLTLDRRLLRAPGIRCEVVAYKGN